ncbi:tectonic-like complex member MKS1 isoform X2 [Tachypleus tridentatus]
MWIMADIRPDDCDTCEEVILCSIGADTNGVLIVSPDFNFDKEPYIIQNSSGEEFKVIIQHASEKISKEEKEREKSMLFELYSRKKELVFACIGKEFDNPALGVFRVFLFGEIVSAYGFSDNNLYVHYILELPLNWTVSGEGEVEGVTHACSTKVENKEDVAYFSHPFSFELEYKMKTIQACPDNSLPRWPTLFFKVVSYSTWGHYQIQGYGYIILPVIPGSQVLKLQTWRPLPISLVDKLRTYFIGGPAEIVDPTYLAIPSTFQGNHLSKFGFCSETTGTVVVRLNTVHQQSPSVPRPGQYSINNILDTSGSSMQNSITAIIAAFQRARQRMLVARGKLD